LYTGRIGIAFAAARVGRLLRSDESLEHARALVRDVDVGAFDGEYDLLSGMAGAVVGLLVLRSLLDDRDPNDGPLDRAVRLGDRIVAAAQDRFGGASWPNAAASSRHNLTGLSHGAAGIGHALIELFHATGDVRFRRTAERTFEFERRWFDPAEMNWRDFRESPDRTPVDRAGIEPDAREDRAYALHWCHGAPGIALSRLRAHEILGDEIHAAEARTALDSTRRSLATAAADGRGNFSLCHGLAGNADVLLSASRRADLFGHDGRAGAHEVGQIGIARYGSGALPWPCGGVGETPALMLGLAGIGYFYLRLHDDTTPSLLMLRPD
jgi:lantibiotic modifying enzyme